MKKSSLISFVILLLISCVSNKTPSLPSKEVEKYNIIGHSCECTIMYYGGSMIHLLCTDTTGHMFETAVRNEHIVLIDK